LSRSARLALIGAGVILFFGISFLLARVLSAGGAERTAVARLIKDEARGDGPAMIAGMRGCAADPQCRASATSNAARLKRGGDVQVLNYAASVSLGLANTRGTGRIAWRAGTKPAVVQCVLVERHGNPFTGFSIRLLKLSAPIRSDASCP
jgi:hypothetical protein